LNDWHVALELSNGTFLGCDLVVNAIGVNPNCKPFEELLEMADEKLGSGIAIDKMMKTSAPGVIYILSKNYFHELECSLDLV
jgi:NAD(P)H-nitrite reductase large subunit